MDARSIHCMAVTCLCKTLLANETRMTEIGEVGKDGKIRSLGSSVRPVEAEPAEDGGRACRCIHKNSDLFPLKRCV
jgi:hypothetical protein